MTVYTVIGYKPNGVDSVMGCIQDRVDSDFLFEVFREAETAAEFVASLELAEPYSKYMRHEWEEIIILLDGLPENEFGWNEDWMIRSDEAEDIIRNFNNLKDAAIQSIRDRREAEAAKEKKYEDELAA